MRQALRFLRSTSGGELHEAGTGLEEERSRNKAVAGSCDAGVRVSRHRGEVQTIAAYRTIASSVRFAR